MSSTALSEKEKGTVIMLRLILLPVRNCTLETWDGRNNVCVWREGGVNSATTWAPLVMPLREPDELCISLFFLSENTSITFSHQQGA